MTSRAQADTSADAWTPDPLEGFERQVLPLRAPLVGRETSVQATLLRATKGLESDRPAVLMLPGWIDYFAHPHVANAFIRAGFAVYALEPRRSGRSLSDPAFRDYVTDMHDYTQELDASVALISSLHPSVSLYAHSTGGLIGGLWASEHPGAFNAVALNSPWISWWGGPHVASLFRGPVGALGRMAPEQILWTYRPEYDTTARPIPPARPLLADEVAPMEHAHARAGWVRAVLKGQSDLRKGSIDCPNCGETLEFDLEEDDSCDCGENCDCNKE